MNQNIRDKAEVQAQTAIALICDEAQKQEMILRAAVAWFDQHKPQWGPGTLPQWYSDARSYLRHSDDK